MTFTSCNQESRPEARLLLLSPPSAQKILFSRNVISGMLLKNVAQPLMGLGFILLLPMDLETARAAILLLALPSGFFGILFGLRYGKDSHEAGSTLIVSSFASIVTLTIALVLTQSGVMAQHRRESDNVPCTAVRNIRM